MRQSGVTHEASIMSNLQQFCYEVDSEFQAANNDAAKDCVRYLEQKSIIELGCGDGAALQKFVELGVTVFGVDINEEKLAVNPHPHIASDMLSWLETQPDDSLPNIFMHHALEHIIAVDELLWLISIKLVPSGIFYCVVPADDEPHEVHHTAFDSPHELAPPEMQRIVATKQVRYGHPEYLYIGQKV